MDNKDFIKKIVSEHKTIKQCFSIQARLGIWLSCILLFSILAVNFDILRADIYTVIFDLNFFLACISLLGSSISLAYLALILSIPGKQSKFTNKLTILNLIIIGLTLGITFYIHPNPFSQSDIGASIHCSSSLVFLSLIPGIALFFLMKIAAVQACRLASFLMFLAAGAFGAFILQISCMADSPLHIFLYHLLPVLLIGSFGIVVAKKIFR